MIRIAVALVFFNLSCVPARAIAGDAAPADAVIARNVVMISSSRGTCTGAPLGQDLVLTAAHCVINASNLKILGHDADRPLRPSDVADIARHPRFKLDVPAAQQPAAPDLALLRLFEHLPTRFAPAPLTLRPVAVGDRVIVVGYGVAAHGDSKTAGTARMAMLIVVGRSGNRFSLRDQISYGEDGLAACSGDSGAPAFAIRGGVPALFGVVSGGSAGCGGITIVTPLGPHRDWLVEAARKLGSPLGP
jgi:hypothetical protein